MEYVVLVDKQDRDIGKMEKMEAHEKGLLHRAFSIFIFNSSGHILLHQRAESKYHSANLWTNTCCSHPRVNESLIDGANRRLLEEMGMKASLDYAFNFIYKVELENNLFEHEFDHVFYGVSDVLPVINPLEVKSYKYESPDLILRDIEHNPENYTTWFKICFIEVLSKFRE